MGDEVSLGCHAMDVNIAIVTMNHSLTNSEGGEGYSMIVGLPVAMYCSSAKNIDSFMAPLQAQSPVFSPVANDKHDSAKATFVGLRASLAQAGAKDVNPSPA